MSSENNTTAIADEQLRVDAGTQLLVSVSSMHQPLSLLPTGMSGNLLIVSSQAPATVEQALRDRGIDPTTAGLVPISGSEIEYDGPLWTSEPVVPDDLTGLSMRFTSALDALEPGHGWVLFDSLNALAMYAQEDRVCRCFDHLAEKARERDLRGVYTVAADALDDETTRSFERSVDRTLDRR